MSGTLFVSNICKGKCTFSWCWSMRLAAYTTLDISMNNKMINKIIERYILLTINKMQLLKNKIYFKNFTLKSERTYTKRSIILMRQTVCDVIA
ncbi:hypothetical protein QKQ66_gp047 [Dione juno nucleopolyhedrovirus]|uniref:Uncharacterized protein n=1 Tax=Dione juno nucleopolyhedrovirus TaxID=2594175 RepID=A0AAE6LC63_9ABAC|nr:hypothetical protein QKQ66_gp047 [Dione juno nucleopolyhedrovirus]QDL56951.1 hypothetical protein DijuNPV-ORF-47 [Dione juno nucleopolyhedrovirus]